MSKLKRLVSLILATLMLCAVTPCISAADMTAIYVSPNGSDNADGTIDDPLQTLAGAKQKVSDLKKGGIKVKEVIFREGEYRIKTAVNFTAEDSGTKENPIVYRSYDGETASFKGSVELDITKAERVTDEDVIARLRSGVEGKLLKLDLAAQGLKKSQIMDSTRAINVNNGSIGPNGRLSWNTLYVDGKEQDIAQWPNGERYDSWEKTISANQIKYAGSEPSRWVDAKGWWIGIFPDYDFRYISSTPISIDVENKVITANTHSTQPFTNPWSKRWKAFNLLEELDMPGEFYIDRDTMTLYFYPPHTLADSTIELSLQNHMITGTEFSNVTFKDLEISQGSGYAFNFKKNIDNVDILDCYIHDIGGSGVRIEGTKDQQSGRHGQFIGLVRVDASSNVDIKGNIIENIGTNALFICGGDGDNLIHANNVIENNYIATVNTRNFLQSAVTVAGCGFTVRQNTITNVNEHGIDYWGNDIVVEQNEVCDAIRMVADAAAIYSGRNQIMRGHVVRQNFVHDIQPASKKLVSGTVGIYRDDGQQGGVIEQNLIVNCGIGYNSNFAAANEVRNNIIVNCKTHWAFHNAGGFDNDTADVSAHGTVDDAIATIVNKDLYFKAYPLLKEWAENKTNPKKWNVIDGNLVVGNSVAKVASQDTKHAQWGKNIQVPTAEDLIDPEHFDYRVKADSEILKELPNLPNESNFDLDAVGAQLEMTFNEETAPFRLLYPENGQRISCQDVQLSWEQPRGANKFRLTVAKDREFKEIVYDDVENFNFADLGNLEQGETYYWKVSAINITSKYQNEWAHDGVVYSFTTTIYDPLNTIDFENAVGGVERYIPLAPEGDIAGTFKVGTSTLIRKYIDITKTLTSLRLGRYSQTALDARTKYISDFYGTYAERNGGFVDLLQYNDPQHWSMMTVNEDGTIVNSAETTAERKGGTTSLSKMAGSVIYCFDIKMENNGTYIIVGLNKKIDIQYQADNNGYTLVSKSDMLELQKNDGSTSGVIDSRKGVTLNDGATHAVMFGYLNTSIGTHIITVVDGELVFDYADVSTSAQKNQPMEIVTTARPGGAKITISRSENIPTKEDFDKLLTHIEYKAAQGVTSLIKGVTGMKYLRAGNKKVVTEKGVYDSSFAVPEMRGGEFMVPAATVSKMFEGTPVSAGSNAVFTIRGKTFAFSNGSASFTVDGAGKSAHQTSYMKNGYLMISIKSVLESIGLGLNNDLLNNVYTTSDTGTINWANESNPLKQASNVLDKLEEFDETDDVLFAAVEKEEPDEEEEVLLDAPIEAEEKIAILGDSLTRDSTYISYFDSFLKTRFPDKRIRLINAGTDGIKAVDMQARLKTDVFDKGATKAIVCFGANDVVRNHYPNGSAADKAKAIADANANLEKLVQMLQDGGVTDIVLMSPATQDDRDGYNPRNANGLPITPRTGLSDALNTVADNVKKLANKYGLEYIDINTITDEILDRAVLAKSTVEEIISSDRVHPNETGYFIIATKMAETLFADNGVVASVNIDAGTKAGSAVNASVADIVKTSGGISFTYQAKSLPFAVNATYEKAQKNYGRPEGVEDGEYFDFTEKMNREIIKVTGLEVGNYTIAFGDTVIGTYTSGELAQGVNIAVNKKNPGQIQAAKVASIYSKIKPVAAALRTVETMVWSLQKNGAYTGDMAKMVAWLNENNYSGTYFSTNYEKMDTYYKQVWTAEADAYEMAKPQSYKVTIAPAK